MEPYRSNFRYPAFHKIHGCGNAFVVTSSGESDGIDWPTVSRRVAHRSTGLGTDGLMVVAPPSSDSEIRVLMFNPDGTPMGMCGNGIRCVVRYLHITGLVESSRRDIVFEVSGRIIRCN